MSLWDSVRDSLQKTAEKAGSVALVAGQKTKLNAEFLLVERDISLRKQLFGVQLYDYVAPLSSKPEFYACDDKQTDTLRPPLITAQREIAALEIRKTKIKEQQAQAQVTRRAAFPTPAQSIGGKMLNAGKSSVLAANEAKLMTDLASVTRLIQAQKEEFGEKLYDILVELEDKEGWLPTDREIRSIYDQARRDVEKLVAKKAAKEQELKNLDDPNAADSDAQNGNQPAVYNTPTVPAASPSASVTTSYGSTAAQPTYGVSAATSGQFGASAPVPATAAPVAASYGATQQQQRNTVDPFASRNSVSTSTAAAGSFSNTTNYAPPAPAPAAADPFAGMTSAFPPATQASAPAADPFANAAGYQAPAPAVDPFANAVGYTPAQAPVNSFGGNTHDPFAGMSSTSSSTTTPVDPFAPRAGSSNTPADPFAGLSSSSGGAQAPAPVDPFAGTIFAGTSQGSTHTNASQFNRR